MVTCVYVRRSCWEQVKKGGEVARNEAREIDKVRPWYTVIRRLEFILKFPLNIWR